MLVYKCFVLAQRKFKKLKWVQSQQKLSYFFHANSTDLSQVIKSVQPNFSLSLYLDCTLCLRLLKKVREIISHFDLSLRQNFSSAKC